VKGNRRIGGQALIIFYRSIMMIAHTLSKHVLKIGERDGMSEVGMGWEAGRG